MKRTFAVLAVISAALIMATPALATPIAVPHMDISALHFGGGIVQFTLVSHNPVGGAHGVQITAQSLGPGVLQQLPGTTQVI